MSLSTARDGARECRRLLHDGVDPLAHKRAQHLAARIEAAKTMTFEQCAEAYIEAHKAGWRNDKHIKQWSNTLTTYAYPVFGTLPVQTIDTGLVVKVLDPIWRSKPETASRLRGRIESVLAFAIAREYRLGDNPARWKGHLDQMLPKRSKIRAVKHHAALAYNEIATFMTDVRRREAVAARALEFLILTAARTGEVLGATWSEIDFDECTWNVPAIRMKAGREHRVPLSEPAIAVLKRMQAMRDSDFVFPGARRGKALSNMALLVLLRRMERGELTAHGFRSSFRDWAAERTGFANEVVEMALAHAIPSKAEAAYRRGDLFEKRQLLMAAWAEHCEHVNPIKNNVVSLQRESA